MVMDQLKNAFWEAMIDCLEQFHAVPGIEAKEMVFDLRSEVEGTPSRTFDPDIIYHDEPFYVAARLAGRDLDLSEHGPAYRAIRARRFGHIGDGAAGAGVPATPVGASSASRGVW